MPTAARSPHMETAPSDPDAGLGAQESQVSSTAAVEGRPSHADIAREAYFIYRANGSQHGRHEDDWSQAERRLLGADTQRQADAIPQQATAQLDAVDTADRTPG